MVDRGLLLSLQHTCAGFLLLFYNPCLGLLLVLQFLSLFGMLVSCYHMARLASMKCLRFDCFCICLLLCFDRSAIFLIFGAVRECIGAVGDFYTLGSLQIFDGAVDLAVLLLQVGQQGLKVSRERAVH